MNSKIAIGDLYKIKSNKVIILIRLERNDPKIIINDLNMRIIHGGGNFFIRKSFLPGENLLLCSNELAIIGLSSLYNILIFYHDNNFYGNAYKIIDLKQIYGIFEKIS